MSDGSSDYQGEDRRVPNTTLTDVHESLSKTADAMTEMARAIVHYTDKRDRWRDVLLGILVVVVILLSSLTYFSFRQGQANYDAITASQHAEQLIKDCTTPGGRCFEDSQERTGVVIKDLVKKIREGTAEERAQLQCDLDKEFCLPGYVPGGSPPPTTSGTTTTTTASAG